MEIYMIFILNNNVQFDIECCSEGNSNPQLCTYLAEALLPELSDDQ